MSEKLTRQQIYDRIRATSKDSYILEEMKRLGFWEKSQIPTPSETLITREVEISQELNQLMAKDRKYKDQDAMLKEMRKARMKAAREKREQTRQRNTQKRLDKAARWKALQMHQVLYLGKGVSAGLNNTEANTEQLRKHNLPVFSTLAELAADMQTDLNTLSYLLFQREVSRSTHYHTFGIPKKSGGVRKISAPKSKMKALQNWVLSNILNQIPVCPQAHGFIRSRSIVTNAHPHTGKDIVINIDLKDFFPSIDYKRVKGLFHKLGYSEQMATIFALICTQAETDTVEMDGVTYYVQKGKRFLPQGSPASPAVSNLIAYRLDRKVQGLASKLGFTYTRYADDLSFSTSNSNKQNVARLLHFLRKIIETEGLTVNPEKTHIMRNGGQQKVTGLVVNRKLNVDRTQLRKFRALLHNIEMNGWNGQKWGRTDNILHAIEGYIHFIKMVNPEKGIKFYEQLKRIVEKHSCPPGDTFTPQENSKPINVLTSEEPNAGNPFIDEPQTDNKVDPSEEENKADNTKNQDWWNVL